MAIAGDEQVYIVLIFVLINVQSQEFKYNRQAFDQKARSMTEKYARSEASEIASGGQSCQTFQKPSIKLVSFLV